MKFFPTLLTKIAQGALWLTGWQQVDSNELAKFHQNPRKIAIFPHTTYWDYPILVTYMLAYWQDSHDLYVAVRADWANGWLRPIFRYFRAIPIPRSSNNLLIHNLTQKFQGKGNFTILIAPEGTTKRENWRSGYYHLAKNLNCPIQVMGLDYYRHQVVIGKTFHINGISESQLKTKIFVEMSTITPLYPENSIVYYEADRDFLDTSLFDRKKFRLCVTIPLSLLIYFISPMCWLLFLIICLLIGY